MANIWLMPCRQAQIQVFKVSTANPKGWVRPSGVCGPVRLHSHWAWHHSGWDVYIFVVSLPFCFVMNTGDILVFIYGLVSSLWSVHLLFNCCTVHFPSQSPIWEMPPSLSAIFVFQAPAQDIRVYNPKGELEFSPLRWKGTPLLEILHKICQPGSQMTWHFHL